MKRLTYRLITGATNLVGIIEAKEPFQKAILRQNGWERLAEYEETGLTPPEIMSLKADYELLCQEVELLRGVKRDV